MQRLREELLLRLHLHPSDVTLEPKTADRGTSPPTVSTPEELEDSQSLFSLLNISQDNDLDVDSVDTIETTCDEFLASLAGQSVTLMNVDADLHIPAAIAVLGSGQHGFVMEGTLNAKDSRTAVAIKAIPVSNVFRVGKAALCDTAQVDEDDNDVADRRIKLCQLVDTLMLHYELSSTPGVLPLVGFAVVVRPVSEEKGVDDVLTAARRVTVLIVVMQRAHTSLAEALRKCGALQERVAINICVKLAGILQNLWNRMFVIHSDVKPLNCLVNFPSDSKTEDWGRLLSENQFALLLTDFDCSTRLRSTTKVVCDNMPSSLAGTPAYMSPEACRGEEHPHSDVWSLGILAFQIVTGRLPWRPLEVQLPSMIAVGLRNSTPEQPFRPELNELHDLSRTRRISEGFVEFVEKCLDDDAGRRPSPAALITVLQSLQRETLPALH